jgi:hypothetical protein
VWLNGDCKVFRTVTVEVSDYKRRFMTRVGSYDSLIGPREHVVDIFGFGRQRLWSLIRGDRVDRWLLYGKDGGNR